MSQSSIPHDYSLKPISCCQCYRQDPANIEMDFLLKA